MGNVRGVDHIGLTVIDIEEAHRFLTDGLGAELMYDLLPPGSSLEGPEVEKLVEVPAGTKITLARMYRLAGGPSIELFHYVVDDQRAALRACDVGFQHVALFVEDIEAAAEKMVAAGGRQMAEPWGMIGPESGEDNRFCFVKAPFGAMFELVSYGDQAYMRQTSKRKWRPGAGME